MLRRRASLAFGVSIMMFTLVRPLLDSKQLIPIEDSALIHIRGAGEGAQSLSHPNCEELSAGSHTPASDCVNSSGVCVACDPHVTGTSDVPSWIQATPGYNFSSPGAWCGSKYVGWCNPISGDCEDTTYAGTCDFLEVYTLQ